jgi:hypothetical protein
METKRNKTKAGKAFSFSNNYIHITVIDTSLYIHTNEPFVIGHCGLHHSHANSSIVMHNSSSSHNANGA